MSERSFLARDYKAIYDDILREASQKYLASAQIDVGRNRRLLGALVGTDERTHRAAAHECINVARWCDFEITNTLIPIYTRAKRFLKQLVKWGESSKIEKIKRQMSYFVHTHIMLNSMQEAAFTVIDAYFNQYETLVTKGLAPELSEEEKERRGKGPTRIPVDELGAERMRKRRHAAEGRDKAERSGLGTYDRPKSSPDFKEAFAMAPEDVDVESMGLDIDVIEPEPEKKKKPKKKKPKKSKG